MTQAPQAGYSGTPLPRKLGIRPGARVGLYGAPAGFGELLGALPDGVRIETAAAGSGPDDSEQRPGEVLPGTGPFDVIVFFTMARAELAAHLSGLRARMTPAAGLWIAFPKRASKVPTDMTDHVIREIALPTGLVDNKICAIDAVWTGVRMVIRRELR